MLSRNRHLGNERGIVLISALAISVIIFLTVVAFGYRTGLFVRTARSSEVKTQSFYTNEMFLEVLRAYMWENFCAPPDWCNINFAPISVSNDAFYDVSSDIIAGTIGTINDITINVPRTTPTRTINLTTAGDIVIQDSNGTELDRYSAGIFLRTTSVPKVIDVMISTDHTAQQGKASIEASLIFDIPCPSDYEQFGQCVSKEGVSNESGFTATVLGL